MFIEYLIDNLASTETNINILSTKPVYKCHKVCIGFVIFKILFNSIHITNRRIGRGGRDLFVRLNINYDINGHGSK